MAQTSTLSKEAQKVMISFVNNHERKTILKLMFNWSDVVGDKTALNSSPRKLKNIPGKGVILTIEVANSAIGTEIYYMKKEIIARANAFLGVSNIVDLVLISNCSPMISKEKSTGQDAKNVVLADEEKKSCEVGDQSLDASLVELLKAIKTK